MRAYLLDMLPSYFSSINCIIFLVIVIGKLQPIASKILYPCSYADTVNITDGLRLKDGSYSYAGLVIPANLIAEYNVKVIDGIEYGTSRHLRGCVCLIRPCINFCCPEGLMYNEKYLNCTPHANARSPHIQQATHLEVTYPNKTIGVINVRDTFVMRHEFGCKNKFIDRKYEHFWEWDLHANGSVSREGKLFTTDEYCYTALEHKGSWSLLPLNCERFQRGVEVWIYAICISLAILMNIFIFLLLISIKEVRNSDYGESVILHLFAVIVGFILLVYMSMKNPMNLSPIACRNVGFIAHFFLILSFVFLTFISWEFHYNFHRKRLKDWRRKLVYCVVLGVACALTYGAVYAQASDLPYNLKPGIGNGSCWFDVRLWGILIYYYLPIVVALVLSFYFCFRAYIALKRLPKDSLPLAGQSRHDLKTHLFAFFTYLMAVSCVWLREMIAYGTARMREHFFVIDFWSGISMLLLGIVTFGCLLHNNMQVRSWWQINVTHRPDNFVYTLPPMDVVNTRQLNTRNRDDNKRSDDDYLEDIALK